MGLGRKGAAERFLLMTNNFSCGGAVLTELRGKMKTDFPLPPILSPSLCQEFLTRKKETIAAHTYLAEYAVLCIILPARSSKRCWKHYKSEDTFMCLCCFARTRNIVPLDLSPGPSANLVLELRSIFVQMINLNNLVCCKFSPELI